MSAHTGTPAGDADEDRLPGRLIAIVVGIDRYPDQWVDDLSCSVNDAEAVANAIEQTQPSSLLDLRVLTSPPRQRDVPRPTRENILQAVRRAAEIAQAGDTILFYFAGHGKLIDRRAWLVPADARRSPQDGGWAVETLIRVDELQAVFQGHRAERRVMFLDCCQSGLAESLQQRPAGWTILFSCGPTEESLEDPGWGEHGIFSHFLSVGLRGEADLDGDGVVSLAELVQYLADRVPRQAEAVIEEARLRGETTPPQDGQHPTLVWGGPIDLPLTRAICEKREEFRGGVIAFWWRFLREPLPYALFVEDRLRYGTAFLYACAMALAVLLFAPWPAQAAWIGLAAGTALISALLWIACVALAGAANEHRWHGGGYVTGELLLAWHVGVGVLLVVVRGLGGQPAELPAATFRLITHLFVIISLLVIFGVNALQCIIALADLLKHNDRLALRRAFVQLDQRWIHADIPNVIAMVSGHPKLYQVVAAVCCGLAVVHATYVFLTAELTAPAAMALLQDAILIVLIQWLAQWYAGAYRGLRGQLLSEK